MTVASFACHCGARDELREPAPVVIQCWRCSDTMYQFTPPVAPPQHAGRVG